jgi:carboxypeptidase PM20D1
MADACRHVEENISMKKALLVLGLGVLVLVCVLLVRTAQFTSRQVRVGPTLAVAIDADAAAARLANTLRFSTISQLDSTQWNDEAFADFHDYVIQSFPRVHAALSWEAVGEHGVLYTWPGKGSAKPILLLSHIDVVPVEPGTESDWEHPPFAGRIADGHIWGRGAIDNKSSVMAILEAVEGLLDEGYFPERTVYLSFGQDEEIGGHSGAAPIADLLASRGIELEYVLDEGGLVVAGVALPLTAPLAMVGIAEKGYLSLVLSVEGKGGHSSMPPRQTAVGILSSALAKLQDNPFSGGLQGPTREFFAYVAPEMPWVPRRIFANAWLFGPLIERQLAASPSADAMLRTTVAPTMFEGSIKDNVLPIRARAVVNLRIIPGETVASVTDRVVGVIDDPRVKVEPFGSVFHDSSAVSPTEAPTFGILQLTIGQVFPDAVVAPFLFVGTTDSRHFQGLTENVYRFQPLRLHQRDLTRVHGTDERVSIESHADAIRFYRHLILNSNVGAGLTD